MNTFARLLQQDLILLELETTDLPEEVREEIPRERYILTQKDRILAELVDLLARSGRVGSRTKLHQDLLNREKKASTGLANGVAIPHVRTIHAKEFLMGFARSTPGVDYDCLDGAPAHLFFVMVAPRYDDVSYLRLYRQLAEAFPTPDRCQEFLRAKDEGEILRALKRIGQG